MRTCLAAVLALASACVQDPTVSCNELTCPAGDVCVASGCATPDEVAACVGAADEDACTATTVATGVCLGGACRSVVCGDGRVDRGEVCDDSNTIAGDGCSATCISDETCGNQVIDTFTGEECDTGVRGLSNDGCTSGCRSESALWQDVTQTPIPGRAGHMLAYDAAHLSVVTFGGYDANGALGDTWVFEKGVWREHKPAQSPSSRYEYAMTYDAARGVVVLFGGFSLETGNVLGDTWTWNGITWTELHPATSPPPQRLDAIAYDSMRQRVVLYGSGTWEWDGTTWIELQPMAFPPSTGSAAYDEQHHVTVLFTSAGETWTWDGTTWTHLTPGTSPSARRFCSMTYDPDNQRVLLFGGSNPGILNETWEWTGTTWIPHVQQSGEVLPSARSEAGLVYDGQGRVAKLFGGYAYDGTGRTVILADDWSWDTVGWAENVIAAASPPPAFNHTDVYDARRGKVVSFGGGAYRQDLWELDQAGWTMVTSQTTPPAGRSYHAFAYDSARGLSVLFGGYSPGNCFDDTWEWNGTSWNQPTVATKPPCRDTHAMVYDKRRDRVVMFGGEDQAGNLLGDTWEWDGTVWSDVTPAAGSPPARYGQAMAYDSARGRTVLFGGYHGDYTPDTWEWDGTAWTNVTPVAPALSPPDDLYFGMTYDPVQRRVVLAAYDQTWTWDGTTWIKQDVVVHGPARFGSPLVYDAIGRRIARHNGADFEYGDAFDAWSYQLAGVGNSSERCLLADEDYDGDGFAGCADPDCWGRCSPLCPPGEPCDPSAPHCGDGTCGPVEDYLLCPSDCPAP